VTEEKQRAAKPSSGRKRQYLTVPKLNLKRLPPLTVRREQFVADAKNMIESRLLEIAALGEGYIGAAGISGRKGCGNGVALESSCGHLDYLRRVESNRVV